MTLAKKLTILKMIKILTLMLLLGIDDDDNVFSRADDNDYNIVDPMAEDNYDNDRS